MTEIVILVFFFGGRERTLASCKLRAQLGVLLEREE